MGHTTEDATRAAEEREKDDLLPLSHRARMHDAVTHRGRRYDALRHWAPILRKVLLATLAGGALATVGAVSGTPGALSDRLAADQGAHHASMAAAAEWLAPVPPGAASPPAPTVSPPTASPPAASPPAPTASPPAPTTLPIAPAASSSASASESTASTDSTAAPGILPDGKVVLNVATAAELTTLPGIGHKRAAQIVELRARLGRFRKLSDLLRVKGIGVKSLRKLTPRLVLDPPLADATTH